MSAARLREAAALMRSRAEGVALTPWLCTSADEERHDGYDVWTHDSETHWTVATAGTAPTAEHIASWHPAVALAVADWLDSEAAAFDRHLDKQANPDRDFNTLWVTVANTRHHHALAVADAYLGGQP